MRDDPPPGLVRFSEAVRAADAVVVVSPEYNGSIPGVLKNALDYIYGEWFRKPVGIVTVSAGGFGGVQVHNHLQLLFLRLKALPVAGMHVSRVSGSFGEDGEPRRRTTTSPLPASSRHSTGTPARSGPRWTRGKAERHGILLPLHNRI